MVSVVPTLHPFLARHIDHVRGLPNHKLVGCGSRFQETHATNYSWCKQNLEGEGRFDNVRCIVCFKINRNDKVMGAKDDIFKIPRLGKTLVNMPSLKVKRGDRSLNMNSTYKKVGIVFDVLSVGKIAT